MATIFCPTCGSKATYMHAPPNYCAKCGQPYVPTFSSKPNLRSSLSNRNIRDDEDEIEGDDFDDDSSIRGDFYSDSNRVPRLSKISVEIDSSTDVRVFKMSDIIGEQTSKQFQTNKPRNLNDFIDEKE